ncbi:hypothetical protein LTR05_003808 [Lithohypha guttulata]|uniref:Uncharacterized protein n=1 Tax=Lithohypha guttulata TaxID=1690604 RepID=A0AAN7YBE1_9EURO|nr:hypothetical protein LTR05_003808 [Lithohypha guttulata]
MVPRPRHDVSAYADPLISERAIDEPRPLKVIYIGAGVSGITAAIVFPRYVPNIELIIYEKNADVGGTWFENRYPGCACDIPAHSYQLSFESKIDWTQFYATQPEILTYWQRVADKYDVRRIMKFNHRCAGARWDENTSKWHITIQKIDSQGNVLDEFEDVGDVFMTATGALNQWKWPDIQGLKDFKGTLAHSANWPVGFDATGKDIAVIGAGSSGIQIVPTLQKKVKHMDHYVRGRTWIAASFGHELVEARNDGQDGNFTYTEEEKEQWRKDPASYVKYRKALECGMQGGYSITHRGTKEHEEAWGHFEQGMRNRLKKKPEVAEHLIPSFPPLCKRLTPGPGYLEALCADNVSVIQTAISHIDETGIITSDGKNRPVDAIVCATGFDTSFQGRFPVIGRNGQNLQDRYRARAETYLSIGTDNFPNYFQSLGPNSGVGNGNLLMIIEAVQDYVGQILRKMATGHVRTIEPKAKAVKNFTDYCDAFFKRTVFSAECGSWYKSSPPWVTDPEERKRGRVSAIWPGSSIHAIKALSAPRWEDFEMTTVDDNEFGWFGDGWGIAERNQDLEGLSWYLNDTKFTHEDLKVETKAEEVSSEQKLSDGDLHKDKAGVMHVEIADGLLNFNLPDVVSHTGCIVPHTSHVKCRWQDLTPNPRPYEK